MHILNTEVFGFMIKPEDYSNLEHAAQVFTDFKLENLGEKVVHVGVWLVFRLCALQYLYSLCTLTDQGLNLHTHPESTVTHVLPWGYCALLLIIAT